MKKKVIVVQISISIIFAALSISTGLADEKPPWEKPWQITETNLYDLIKEGFEVVDVNFFAMTAYGDTASFFEVVYLRKGKQLYRCYTAEKGKTSSHFCEMLISPKKPK